MRIAVGLLAMVATAFGVAAYAQDRSAELLPSREEAKKVCEFVAGFSSPGDFTLRYGVFDVNNDGKAEIVRQQAIVGSMGGDVYEFESPDKTVLEIQDIGFEWKDYWALGGFWLPYDKRVYFLATTEEDGRYPLYLGYITPLNKEHVICEFASATTEMVSPVAQSALEGGICKRVSDKAVTYVSEEAWSGEVPAALRRAEALITSKVSLDFNNDGSSDDLVRQSYASGAGRGCDMSYFDVAEPASAGLVRQILLDAQKVNLDNRHPGRCRANANWFNADGLNYLDIVGRDLREITVITGAKVEQVCQGYYSTKHRVTKYNPLLRESAAR